MITDPDAYRAAKLMIENYGKDARARATLRLDEAVKRKDFGGAYAWRAIQQAIDVLQRQRRKDEAVN
jgi:hypothetical protein